MREYANRVVGLLLKRRKKARMDPPPVPSSTQSGKAKVQVKAETIATTAPEVAVS